MTERRTLGVRRSNHWNRGSIRKTISFGSGHFSFLLQCVTDSN